MKQLVGQLLLGILLTAYRQTLLGYAMEDVDGDLHLVVDTSLQTEGVQDWDRVWTNGSVEGERPSKPNCVVILSTRVIDSAQSGVLVRLPSWCRTLPHFLLYLHPATLTDGFNPVGQPFLGAKPTACNPFLRRFVVTFRFVHGCSESPRCQCNCLVRETCSPPDRRVCACL